ncbi:MAG: glycosyltransferase family 39 protein [Alphaproteobacteria bacterium]|nr:glycosyltransferase family 39 protein [Alphaproteobacteria bacterium]
MINPNFIEYNNLHIKILLSLLVFICFFSSLNTIPPLDRDESRYIQATVQMMESKDFINIKFLDTPRLKKPPGIYWLQALSATIIKNILFLEKAPLWSYRLPSAIAASISIWLTFLLGKLLFGRTEGLIAALLLLSSPLVFIEAHIAKTDSVLMACVLFITYILSKIIFGKKFKDINGSKYLLFFAWIITGFAFLVKGPLVFLFIFFTAIFFRIFSGINFIKDIKIISGFILFLLIALPWFLFINLGDNSGVFIDSIKKDMLFKIISVQESHGSPPGSYFLSSIIFSWPIFLFILPTCIWSYKNKSDMAVVFLLCSILPAWIFFELMPTKLLHYILPILPYFSILTSAMLVSSISNSKVLSSLDNFYIKCISILPAIGGFLISIGILFLAKQYGSGFTVTVLIIAIIYFIGSVLSAYSLFNRNYINALSKVVFVNLIALNIIFITLPNQFDKIWVTEKIYEYIIEKNIDSSFAVLGYAEPSLIYRLGANTKILTSNEEAIRFLSKSNVKYLIIEDDYLNEFRIMADENSLSIRILDKKLSGFNYSKGKLINITLINII